MKLKLIAVAVMSLTATASFAAKPSSCGSTITDIDYINWCAPEATLFIAGSSALAAGVTAVIPDLFEISTDGSKKIFKISDTSATGTANGNKSGTTAWYGTSKTGLFGTPKRLYVVYNNNNGSGAGASLVLGTVKSGKLVSGNPVESNVIYVGPTKSVANTCATSASTAITEVINGVTYSYTSLVTCSNTADIPADLAISDVRAEEVYKFYSNVSKSVKYSNFTQAPLGLQGFGLVVNWNMYKALQDAQVISGYIASSCTATDDTARTLPACQPMVRSVDYATLVKNGGTKSAAIFGLTVSTLDPASTKLTLLRRDDLSGTQSASNMYFLRNACNLNTTLGGGLAVLDQETSDTNFAMVKYPTSSGVKTNAATGYTIGALALSERAIAKDQYNYVKIDGMSPNVAEQGAIASKIANGRDAFAKGDYNFAMTAYGIYKKDYDTSASDKSILINKTILAMKDSTRHNVAGFAYIDGVADTTVLKQAQVNRVGGNNCAPIVKN